MYPPPDDGLWYRPKLPPGESREPATRPAGRLALDIDCSLKNKKAAQVSLDGNKMSCPGPLALTDNVRRGAAGPVDYIISD